MDLETGLNTKHEQVGGSADAADRQQLTGLGSKLTTGLADIGNQALAVNNQCVLNDTRSESDEQTLDRMLTSIRAPQEVVQHVQQMKSGRKEGSAKVVHLMQPFVASDQTSYSVRRCPGVD